MYYTPGVFFTKTKRINIFMDKTINYIKEVIAEAHHVTWPTRKQTIFFTIAVLAVSLIVAYYLGLLDYLFSNGLNFLLTNF
jgi:preprotein translocase subunit SecE